MLKKVCLTMASVAAISALVIGTASAGNDKLVVKDNATPTPNSVFAVQDDGTINGAFLKWDPVLKRMGVNTVTPGSPMEVVAEWPTSLGSNTHSVFTSYGDSSRFTIRMANGTKALPTKTLNGAQLGNLNFRGYDGTNFNSSANAAIVANAEEDFTPTSMATRLVFFTTPVGQAFGAERLRITPSGNIGIGTSAPTSKLQVVGLPVYADNAAALLGGLTAGAFYRTSTGVLMVVY
ncbi:MAG: hypothetical protein FD174_2539 [Geobacteraceae bacterium]|nr:MAG: hypothetical protein FD174_2539 [Geobacteraceae bacterium]